MASPSGMISTTQSSTPQTNLRARQRENRKTTPTAPAFLSNLGKATLRGLRKCPQCGFYNGTRGLSCKNKACGIILRDGSGGGRSIKKGAIEVVKVIIDGGEENEGSGMAASGSGGGIFSVCQRGRGAAATQLGFVELVPTDTTISIGDGTTLLARINLGRCFMPSCQQAQKSNQSQSAQSTANISKEGPSWYSLCAHIKQAMECQNHATPLTLKSSVLEGLQASVQAREQLWRLLTETPGPLVQQVSKDTLVVKCHIDSDHPLGLLHLTIGVNAPSVVSKSGGKTRKEPQQHAFFRCACQISTRKGKPGTDRARQPGVKGSSVSHCLSSSATSEPCLHFYACVCAFASDAKLASDFAAFINYSPSGVQQSECGTISAPDKTIQQPEPISPHYKAKRLRSDDSLSAASVVIPAVSGREAVSSSSVRKAGQRKTTCANRLKTPGSAQFVDEQTVTMGFRQWLASVTERIHQTMHYQFDGKPDPLVYHIPQEFFNALHYRLSLDSKKRRLPNTTTAFVKNDGLPLGSFYKYTWHITSLLQVKRIFDTPELPLELTQSFVKNIDGSYSRFYCPEPPTEPEVPEGYRLDKPQAIRPMELRTFLRVGSCATEQKDPIPFVIEWIPDILPRSGIGELRISFEFGHQQSGQDFCNRSSQKNSGTEKGSCTKFSADSTQPKHTAEVL